MADRQEEIIAAALRVFAREGFHKASIKQIAAEAGLNSPSLIYWYFKDKNELLNAVLHNILPLVGNSADLAPLLELAPEQFLRVVVQSFFAAFQRPQVGQLLRVILSEILRSSELMDDYSSHILPILDLITTYLRQQIKRGALRSHDPAGIARALIGTLIIYELGTLIFTPLGVGFPQQDVYADEIVAVFLKGLQP